MRIHQLACIASVVATLGMLAIATPTVAAPLPTSAASLGAAVASPVAQVRWRARGPGWRGPGRYWRGGRWVWGGAVIGGIIASQAYGYPGPAYYGPPGPGYNEWLAYCSSRYRSFDPASGTYMGYDGHRHVCR